MYMRDTVLAFVVNMFLSLFFGIFFRKNRCVNPDDLYGISKLTLYLAYRSTDNGLRYLALFVCGTVQFLFATFRLKLIRNLGSSY